MFVPAISDRVYSLTLWCWETWLSLHLLIAYSLRFSLYLQHLGRCPFGVSSWTWQLNICSLVLIVVLIGCLCPHRRKLLQKVRVKMRNSKSIILWSCQWAGMASQFLTGSTSSMDLARYLASVNVQPPSHFCKSAMYASFVLIFLGILFDQIVRTSGWSCWIWLTTALQDLQGIVYDKMLQATGNISYSPPPLKQKYMFVTWILAWLLCRNSNVRFVEMIAIGVDVPLSDISRNGDINMGCGAWASQTPKTSMRSHLSR